MYITCPINSLCGSSGCSVKKYMPYPCRSPRYHSPQYAAPRVEEGEIWRSCVTWLMRDMTLCDMTHVRQDSCVTWHVCDTSLVWRDSCVTRLTCAVTHARHVTHVWHDSCVTWRMCDMTHVWYDSCVTWFMCDKTRVWRDACGTWLAEAPTICRT